MHGLREARSRCNSCSNLNSMWDAIASSILGVSVHGEGNQGRNGALVPRVVFFAQQNFRMMATCSEMGRMTWEENSNKTKTC